MSDRTVRACLPTGRTVDLTGQAAELVALLALGAVSPRSLGLLHALATHESALASLRYGCVLVDLTPTRAKIYRRTQIDQQVVGEWHQPKEDTSAA